MTLHAAAGPLPFDVRLMNAVSRAVFVGALVVLAAAGLLALLRASWFPIRAIQLEGELTRNSLSTVRANAAPKLAGGFFSFDLQRGRAAFESVPWVRQAVLRRVWPDRLAVRLEEHQPAAIWAGEDGNDKLVNRQGEVFEANIGDVEEDGLPTLDGPEGSSAPMLSMVQRLTPVLARADMAIGTLRLSGRGSWRAELDSGASIELGRGTEDEVVERCDRFVRTLAQVTARIPRPLEYADLRHADGYALRLKGVSTAAPEKPGVQRKTR